MCSCSAKDLLKGFTPPQRVWHFWWCNSDNSAGFNRLLSHGQSLPKSSQVKDNLVLSEDTHWSTSRAKAGPPTFYWFGSHPYCYLKESLWIYLDLDQFVTHLQNIYTYIKKNKTKPNTSLSPALPSLPPPTKKPLARPHSEIKSMGPSNARIPIPVDISVSTSSHM